MLFVLFAISSTLLVLIFGFSVEETFSFKENCKNVLSDILMAQLVSRSTMCWCTGLEL